MRIESIALQNVGRFTESVSVGPLDAGLNVLAANNEAGKSTLLMAAARALFDRHSGASEEIKALQPVGTALAPEITVVFSVAQGRFRIHKRFLGSPLSELHEHRGDDWHPLADGDAADERTLDLIGGVRPGRGATKPEHWGLMRYLWARQEDPAEWPEWEGGAGTTLRTGLARVELDPLVEALVRDLVAEQETLFTATGQVRKNGPLFVAVQEQAQLDQALTETRGRLAALDARRVEYSGARDELAVRRAERSLAEAEAARLTAALRDTELLRKDLEKYQAAFDSTRGALELVHTDVQRLAAGRDALAAAEPARLAGRARCDEAVAKEKGLRAELVALRAVAQAKQEAVKVAKAAEERLRDLAELGRLAEGLEQRQRLMTRVVKAGGALEVLRKERAGLPEITPVLLRDLRQLERQMSELTIRLEASGLTVTLCPLSDGTVQVVADEASRAVELTAGEDAPLRAARAMCVHLPDWGEVRISSGASEPAELQAELAAVAAKLAGGLKMAEVESVEAADAALAKGRELDREIKAAEKRLTELLEDWASVTELEAAVSRESGQLARLRERLVPRPGETDRSQADLKSDLHRQQTQAAACEGELKASLAGVDGVQSRIDEGLREKEQASAALAAIEKEMGERRAQVAAIEERYAAGLPATEAAAQSAFVAAKAELDVARGKLPEDWEKLPARHDRALKAASESERALDVLEQRLTRLEAVLTHEGAEGLYGRETELIERLEGCRARTDSLRRRGMAARLLSRLIRHRKDSAVRTVLAPLEAQLSATFGEITGVVDRQVFLDENLGIRGVGRCAEELLPFASLSQGAKEQLLLSLRAAVALELAKTGPQILILDDVLVNTDPVRQARVLDVVQSLAQRVQVLVVTCHAERYRGVGQGAVISSQ